MAFFYVVGSPTPITGDWSSDSGRPRDAGDGLTLSYVVSGYPWSVGLRERRGEVSVDILAFRDGQRYRVQVSAILFSPWAYSLYDARSAAFLAVYRAENARVPDHGFSIKVYSNAVPRGTSGWFSAGQAEKPVPASLRRAVTVTAALIPLGIDVSRNRATGLGAGRPVADCADGATNWRNRRV